MSKIILTEQALDDMAFFTTNSPKLLVKITQLFESMRKNPFEGIGKPEPLKYNYSGCWSRRITDEHRLIYLVEKDTITILNCRFHYS